MNPVSSKDSQDDTRAANLVSESIDSVTGERRTSIKGIIKPDRYSIDVENTDLARLKSKIVSFSSYDNCLLRGSIPSKSVKVNLNDDTIPDKTIIGRRLSKLEDDIQTEDKTTASGTDIAENKEVAEDKTPDADKKTADDQKVAEQLAQMKTEIDQPADEKITAEENFENKQETQAKPNEQESEEPAKADEISHVQDNTKTMVHNEPNHSLNIQNPQIAQIIDSMRPDQNIPRQYVIIEYIEQFYIDDDEDPETKAIFESHHTAPNLASFTGKSNIAQQACTTAPITRSVIKIFDETNEEDKTVSGLGKSEYADIPGINNLPPINMGYEYHGASTSIADRNMIFPFCHCQQKELNCGKVAPSDQVALSKSSILKKNKSKQVLNTNKSRKIPKPPQKVSTIKRSNSTNSKSRLHSVNRKNGKKKK